MRRASFWSVVALSAATAVWLWMQYSPRWTLLWTDLIHDRNAHLDVGLAIASDLMHGRVIDLLRDIHWSQTWPPLHEGVAVGLTMLLSGGDPKMAVLPDLVAFALTAITGFVLTRRLLPTASETNAALAGAVTAMLLLVSPSGRAYAIDVMIESPGACLTLVALAAVAHARSVDTERAWTWLAVALAALFFTKYNYWLIVAAAAAPLYWRHAAATIRAPRSVFTARRLGPLLRWHVLPSLLWLLLPGKFWSFVRVLWPGTNQGEFPATDRFGGWRYYATAAADFYHQGAVSALLVAALATLAVVVWLLRPRTRPASASTILIVVSLAIVTTVLHPNRKVRFLHSWIPIVDVLAGVGIGILLSAGHRVWRVAATTAAVGMLLAQAPGLIAAPRAPEGGLQRSRPTALEISAAYLPDLADAQHPAIFSNIPLKFFARWTYMHAYGRSARPITELAGYDAATVRPENAVVMRDWIAAGKSDVIVLIDVPRTSPWYVEVPGCAGLEQLAPLIAANSQLIEVDRRVLDERGGVTITVWRRAR